MLLAIDIGNTNIVLGLMAEGAVSKHWRIATDKRRTGDEYGAILRSLLGSADFKADIKGAVMASVVPSLVKPFREALSKYVGVEARVVGEDLKYPMPVLTDNPAEVGADRLVNAVAAFSAYGGPLVVVDLGTAATFDYVTAKGEFAGGAIAPGVSVSAEALYRKAAKLPRVDAVRPERAVGRNTVEAMRSGLYWGFAGLVDGIIGKIIEERGGSPRVVATGGLAPLVIGASRYVAEADEFLTLKGLHIIYEGNG